MDKIFDAANVTWSSKELNVQSVFIEGKGYFELSAEGKFVKVSDSAPIMKISVNHKNGEICHSMLLPEKK
jgi:hypothetical protein